MLSPLPLIPCSARCHILLTDLHGAEQGWAVNIYHNHHYRPTTIKNSFSDEDQVWAFD